MRGTSLEALLEVEKVQHAPFSVDLFPAETASPDRCQPFGEESGGGLPVEFLARRRYLGAGRCAPGYG